MRYDIMNSELGPIFFSRDDKGINRVHFLNSAKPLPRDESCRQTSQDPLLQDTRRQLEAYFSGKCRQFSLPPSLEGTAFKFAFGKRLPPSLLGRRGPTKNWPQPLEIPPPAGRWAMSTAKTSFLSLCLATGSLAVTGVSSDLQAVWKESDI